MQPKIVINVGINVIDNFENSLNVVKCQGFFNREFTK